MPKIHQFAKDMNRAALAADTLALGVHWIYDPGRVAALFNFDPRPMAPQPDSYHRQAAKGGFTHFGDQIMVLLESVSELKTFSLPDWADRWRLLFHNYKGYMDHATQDTLANFAAGLPLAEVGSQSRDMAPAGRLAPLYLVYDGQEKQLLTWAREQASLTTRHPLILELVEFWAALQHRVLEGADIPSALTAAEIHLKDAELRRLYRAGLDSAAEADSTAVITGFGASCDAFQMFPGLLHLALRYSAQPREAMTQSILGSGDNATRTTLIGTLMAAAYGASFMPPFWYEGVSQRARIEVYLANV